MRLHTIKITAAIKTADSEAFGMYWKYGVRMLKAESTINPV